MELIKTISVIIPSLNEENNIRNTFYEVLKALDSKFLDYEILLFNDGSVDKTGEIIDELAKNNPKVQAIHHEINHGLGYTYQKGVELATMNYIILIPGDNEILGASLSQMFDMVGMADIVIPYSVNMEARPYTRRIISRLFTLLVNALFVCELQYYNGPVIHRRDILQKIAIPTYGFGYQAITLISLIRTGHSFIETGLYLRPRDGGKSSALRFKNIISVFSTLTKLFWKVYISDKNTYNVPIKRVYPSY